MKESIAAMYRLMVIVTIRRSESCGDQSFWTEFTAVFLQSICWVSPLEFNVKLTPQIFFRLMKFTSFPNYFSEKNHLD